MSHSILAQRESTLINSIFGAKVASTGPVKAESGRGVWASFQDDGKVMEILDTRGLQEGSRPNQADEACSSKESIINAVKEKCPDATLFLCKAKEVDAAIIEDLKCLEELMKSIESTHRKQLPILSVLTQCDELDPPDIRKLPTDDEDKNKNIEEAASLLKKHITSNKYFNQNFIDVVRTVAYMRFRQDGSIDPERDYRWNIETLVRILLEELPNEAKLNFARLAQFRELQRKIAWNIVHIASVSCGIVGAEPIPVADLPVLTSIQTVMILGIGYVSGEKLSPKIVAEFLASLGANVGIAFGLRELTRALVRLFPGAGNVVSGAIAAAATEAMGRAAIAYYINRKDMTLVKEEYKKERVKADKMKEFIDSKKK